MLISFLLLAATGLPEPTSYEAMGWISAAVFGMAGGLYYVLCTWEKLFPKMTPPAHEVYATKSEVAALEKEHEDEMKRIEHRFEQWLEQQSQQHEESMRELRAWRNELGKWQMGIENVVGKIDTKASLALEHKSRK